MIEFRLPSLGSDMDKGTLLEWRVQPGDTVKRGDIVAVVDTTKAAIDVECWHDGTVEALFVEAGAEIPVGTLMAVLREPGETTEQVRTQVNALRTALHSAPSPALQSRIAVSPLARRRAAELGVELVGLSGTGPGGAITVGDVESAAKSRPAVAGRAESMRETIATAMSRSKREIPHYYLAEDIPLAAAMAYLGEQNAARSVTERLLLAPLLLQAVARTLLRFPEFNGFFRDGAFCASTAVHVGVAIALRTGGLVAPALRNVPGMNIDTLNGELLGLVARARAGSLRSSEISEATITVTSLGEQGVGSVFPIIYPPQVAIVGFGRVLERPWVVDGAVKAVPLITASLGADHRVSDGHRGGRFLAAVRELLQRPQDLAKAPA